ncbi:MAG: hypothetical protein ACOX12_09190 [Eggerthellaceae bacterium]
MFRRRGGKGLSAPKKAAIAAAVLAVLLTHRDYGPARRDRQRAARVLARYGDASEQPADDGASEEGANEQAPDAAEAGGDASEAMRKALESHAWQQDGNSKTTIQFRNGSFVESDGTNAKVTAVTVQKATWGEGGGTLECKLIADGDRTERSSVISLSGKEGSYKVSCDGFLMAKEYVQASASATAVSVEGLTEPYTSLIDGRNGDLAKAVASYCREPRAHGDQGHVRRRGLPGHPGRQDHRHVHMRRHGGDGPERLVFRRLLRGTGVADG